ncbi:MAG: hypothetical protein ACFE0Q_02285 [Anaerolineae bacterium]
MTKYAHHYRIGIALVILLSLLWLNPHTAHAQDDNLCRDTGAPTIAFGETLGGVVDPTIPFSLFCFEAERGNTMTVTLAPSSPNLLTGFVVNTPFVNSQGSFTDAPLGEAIATQAGAPYQQTVEIPADGTYVIFVQSLQDTQGAFNITLERSGENVLGTMEEETPDDDQTASEGISNIVLGETDLCTTIYSSNISYDEVIEDSTDDTEPLFYCFEGSEGDLVTVDFSLESDVPMGFFVVDPLYDGTQNAIVYTRGIAETPDQPVNNEFLLPADGRYVLIIVSAVQDTGSYSFTVSSMEGNIYTCDNEPLSTLTSHQWGIRDTGDTPAITVNIACSDVLALSTFGGALVAVYDVTQDDEFVFVYQNRLFVTTALSDEEWVIENEQDGQVYTLQALNDVGACTTDDVQTLIRGSWRWELGAGQTVLFDFTCNGVVIIDNQQEDLFTAPYTLTDNEITIDLGIETLTLSDITIAEAGIDMTLDGMAFTLENTLYESDETDTNTESTD